MEREYGEQFALFSKLINIDLLKKKRFLRSMTADGKHRMCVRLLAKSRNSVLAAILWQKRKADEPWAWEGGITLHAELKKRSLIPLMAYDEMYADEGIDDAGLLVYLDHWLTVTALRRYRME